MGRVTRVAWAAAVAVLALAGSPKASRAAETAPLKVVLFADFDDDDDDGIADFSQNELSGARASDVRWLDERLRRARLEHVVPGTVRVVGDGESLAAGSRAKTRLGLQGLRGGTTRVAFSGVDVDAVVLEVLVVDGSGERVDLATSHASLSRVLPASLTTGEPDPKVDPDALYWFVAGPEAELPQRVRVVSMRPAGEPLDVLTDVATAPFACPPGVTPGLQCRRTPLIRATTDIIDRSHPGSSGRSLRAEVGGRLALFVDGRKASALRVGGPRKTALGPLSRYRAKLRVRIVRLAPGGSLPIGGDERGALAIAREEVRTASGLWGQCGIHFGPTAELDVKVVDPPPPYLIAVGCDLGLPASGGELSFRAAGRELRVPIAAGQTPTEVANALAVAVRKSGLRADVSPNARISQGALRTVDVLVRRADGSLVRLEPTAAGLSTDKTLRACLGEVDLADGLTHFTDFDAVAGTVEERSLIKAFDDGDPSTLDVFIIPNFARSGRIGESFIYADGASVRNVVIMDRAGVRAGARSYALAHELGHILLDMPGHPDDYGVDSSEALMDADAADATIFGPRRLSVAECERAISQSGPLAPVPLLSAWPLTGASAKRR